MVTIGKIYKIQLRTDQLEFKLKRASEGLIKKCPHYADVNGKVVMVLSKDKNTSNVKVGIMEKDQPSKDLWLTISEKWLSPLDGSCTCDTRILMCRGCLCGAFNYEQNDTQQQKNKLKTKPKFEPW